MVATTTFVATIGVATWYRPKCTLIALTFLIPFLNGCGTTGLLPEQAVTLALSSYFLTHLVRHGGIWGAAGANHGNFALVLRLAATLVLASLVEQAAGLSLQQLRSAWVRYSIGYDDPLYCFVAAFIWIQGMSFFELILSSGLEKLSVGALLGTLTVTSFLFFTFQAISGFPAGWSPELKHFCPFEDIHAFGAFSAALFVFLYARATGPQRGWQDPLYCGLAACMVIFSYSRTAWAVAILGLVIVSARRWDYRYVIAITIGVTTLVSLGASRFIAGSHNAYSLRLYSLIKFEALTQKSPERVALFQRAKAMIVAHPLTGVGIGKFYAESTKYSPPDDPIRGISNFAHNAPLQMAAELGWPIVAVALAGLVLLRQDWSINRDAVEISAFIALLVYIATQLTSNAVNIYIGQQLILWVLLYLTFARVLHRDAARELKTN